MPSCYTQESAAVSSSSGSACKQLGHDTTHADCGFKLCMSHVHAPASDTHLSAHSGFLPHRQTAQRAAQRASSGVRVSSEAGQTAQRVAAHRDSRLDKQLAAVGVAALKIGWCGCICARSGCCYGITRGVQRDRIRHEVVHFCCLYALGCLLWSRMSTFHKCLLP